MSSNPPDGSRIQKSELLALLEQNVQLAKEYRRLHEDVQRLKFHCQMLDARDSRVKKQLIPKKRIYAFVGFLAGMPIIIEIVGILADIADVAQLIERLF